LTTEYTEKIQKITEIGEQEKITLKKELQEVESSSKKEEKLLMSLLYDMGSNISRIMAEKRNSGKKSSELSFLAAQINARGQSNQKKV